MMHNPPITADDIDRVLKGLGSLAQNRPFSPADVTRYVGVDGNAAVAILVRSGLVKKTGRAEYALTPAGRSAVDAALGGTGAPAVPVSQRTFTRPTISEVARQLKNLAKAQGSIDPVEGLDVRLQVSPGGGWKLWFGDPAKDLERGERVPRHEGFWGSSVIRRGYSDADLNVVAKQLIDETEEMYSQPEFQYQKSPFGAARPKRNPGPGRLHDDDVLAFRRFLTEGTILVSGGSEGAINLSDDDSVHVAIVVDVTGYGPHQGAIYAIQNRYHGSADAALQPAYELLEEWKLEHYGEHLAELEAEYGDEALSIFTETFDGLSWELTPQDFANAIQGTKAAQYIDTYSEDDDG